MFRCTADIGPREWLLGWFSLLYPTTRVLISMLRRARIVVQSRKETTFPIILQTSETAYPTLPSLLWFVFCGFNNGRHNNIDINPLKSAYLVPYRNIRLVKKSLQKSAYKDCLIVSFFKSRKFKRRKYTAVNRYRNFFCVGAHLLCKACHDPYPYFTP